MTIKRNFIDRCVEAFSPGKALTRLENRKRLESFKSKRSAFEGAKNDRDPDSWNRSFNTSNNLEIDAALPKLRAHSKDLWRNNPYINSAIKRIANNVVGTGIMPSPKTGTPNQQNIVKKIWEDWGETTECDFYGRLNFYGLQKLVMKTVAKTGECFVRTIRVPYRKGKIAIQYQIIDAEFVDHTKSFQNYDSNANYIRNGIEYDRYGRVVAYWLFDRHPNEFIVKSSVRVPAGEIKHIFVVEDPGQDRGLPFVTPSMVRVKDLDLFEDAQLVRQKTAACFTGFIQDETGDGDDTDSDLESMEPGRIEKLPPGKTITFASPPDSGLGYDPYTKNMLRSIASGIGTSYEGLTNDYSNVNFSSGRMGWIEFNRNVEEWQWDVIIPMFCEKVWIEFIEACSMSLLLDLDATIKATWTPPRRTMIDPEKESKALTELVRSGFQSWRDAVKSLGNNPDDVMAEMIKDQAAFDKAGLMLACDPRYDSNRPTENNNDTGEESKEDLRQ